MRVPTGALAVEAQPIIAHDAFYGPRTIVLPLAKASRFGPGKQSAGKQTHQLTLRVSDEYRAYMDALRIEADAENLAQLVRWAVVMLEQALDEGFVIERSDGVMVGDRVVSRRSGVTKTARQGDTADEPRRVNVGLDTEQHALFKRLSKRTGLGLVEMVATALGVLDAWLIDADASDTVDTTAVDAGDDDQVANTTNHLVGSNAI